MYMKVKALIFDWGDTLMRDFREYSGSMFYWPKVEMIPGVDVAMQEVHQRFICCVASNAGDSDAVLMGQALGRVGLKEYFHHLYTSKELGAAKPSPEFFQQILCQIRATPEECIMIGNDYQKDIASAKVVGLKTIWLSEESVTTPAPDADRVIASMHELVKAVSELTAE